MGALFKVFKYDVNAALLASVIYSFLSLILFIVVCVHGWKKVRQMERKHEAETDANEKVPPKKRGCCRRLLSWMKLVWKMKSIYLSALVHIYDIGTDVGIIVDWGL
eukprot:16873_1